MLRLALLDLTFAIIRYECEPCRAPEVLQTPCSSIFPGLWDWQVWPKRDRSQRVSGVLSVFKASSLYSVWSTTLLECALKLYTTVGYTIGNRVPSQVR